MHLARCDKLINLLFIHKSWFQLKWFPLQTPNNPRAYRAFRHPSFEAGIYIRQTSCVYARALVCECFVYYNNLDSMKSRQYKRTANKHVDAFTEHSINNTRITITEYGKTERVQLWVVGYKDYLWPSARFRMSNRYII